MNFFEIFEIFEILLLFSNLVKALKFNSIFLFWFCLYNTNYWKAKNLNHIWLDNSGQMFLDSDRCSRLFWCLLFDQLLLQWMERFPNFNHNFNSPAGWLWVPHCHSLSSQGLHHSFESWPQKPFQRLALRRGQNMVVRDSIWDHDRKTA